MNPVLSIVVVTMNSERFIVECMDSIFAHSPTKCGVEVTVVDNCSNDHTVEIIRMRYPQITMIVNTTEVGLSANNNRGIRSTSGEYVLILNPDTKVLPGALDVMLEFMHRNSTIGVCGPKLLNPDDSLQLSCRPFPTPLAVLARGSFLKRLPGFQQIHEEYVMQDWGHNEVRDVDWVLGACLMIRRETIEQVGFMDEGFRLYYEDIDWCYRVKKGKWRVCYLPQAAIVHHYHRESAVRFNQKTIWHILSILRFFLKHRFNGARPHLDPMRVRR